MSEETIKIVLNGKAKEVAAGTTLMDLVNEHGLKVNSILIEHNTVAIRRQDWTEFNVAESDRVEFLKVVAGG